MPLQNVERGPNLASDDVGVSGITVTGSATAHVKGAWTQLIAATTQQASGVVVMLDDVNVSATNSSTLLDIGVGAAAAERVLVPDLHLGAAASGVLIHVPVTIQKGERVSARLQSAITSKAIPMRVMLIPAAGLADSGQVVDAYGPVAATSAAFLMAAPATVNVKSAWEEITTPGTGLLRPARWVFACLGSPGTNVAALKGAFDVGYGASGAQQPLLQGLRWEQLGTEQLRWASVPVPCRLAAGTALWVRMVSGGAVAAASRISAAVYAVA